MVCQLQMKRKMAIQNKIFPLFFTLERVDNGYILTAKEETGGLSEGGYRKEVVTDDKINSRIGQLLHLDTMVKEHPVVFQIIIMLLSIKINKI